MQDVSSPLRAAYFEALNGQISAQDGTGQTVPVPVLDNVATKQKGPYIHFRDQTNVPDQVCADGTANDATVLLEIVTEYQSDLGGRAQADVIAGQIYARIPSALVDPPGMNITHTGVQMDQSLSKEASQTHSFFRRLIRFRNTIYT